MNIILVMIPLSLLLLIAAVSIFFWAVNKGQYEDLDSPALTPMSDNLPKECDDKENVEKKEDESDTESER